MVSERVTSVTDKWINVTEQNYELRRRMLECRGENMTRVSGRLMMELIHKDAGLENFKGTKDGKTWMY